MTEQNPEVDKIDLEEIDLDDIELYEDPLVGERKLTNVDGNQDDLDKGEALGDDLVPAKKPVKKAAKKPAKKAVSDA